MTSIKTVISPCNDCDDNDKDRYPGNTEKCDGKDNDCNNVAGRPRRRVRQ